MYMPVGAFIPCPVLEVKLSKQLLHCLYAQACEASAAAQSEAAEHAAARSRLEADVVGFKAWIRTLEETEQKYLAALRWRGYLLLASLI